jgi:serine/threonine protein kinase
VAIKTLSKIGIDIEDLEFQMTELGILRSCFCENVVEIIDVFEEHTLVHIVCEFIEGVDLCTYIKSNPRTEALVRKIMEGICSAMDYIHSIGIVHRDIKLENIMITVDSNGCPKPKLIDFGLSTILLNGQASKDRFGTLVYSSPEILLGLEHRLATDVWSLGILLHMLLVGIFPFLTFDKDLTKKNIVYGKLNFNYPGWLKVSNNAKDLVVRMLDKR